MVATHRSNATFVGNFAALLSEIMTLCCTVLTTKLWISLVIAFREVLSGVDGH
jgi:hypothetical protein